MVLRGRIFQEGPPGWLAVVLSVLASFGPALSPVSGGLDSGWQLGLSWARTLGLRWGDDLIFTYGPLGSLAAPVPLSAALVWQALLAQVLALALVAFACWSLTGPRGSWLRLIVMILVTAAAASSGLATALFIGVVLSAVALAVRSPRAHQVVWLLGLIAGISVLIKFNMGCAAIAAGGLASLAATRRGIAISGFFAGSIAGALGAWFGTCQRAVDLLPWLRGSAELARGYPSAMRHVRDDLAGWLPHATLGFAAVMAVALCSLVWSCGVKLDNSRRAVLVLAVLASVGALYLASATRLDTGHLGLLPCSLFALGVPLAMGSDAEERSGRRLTLRRPHAGAALLGMVCISVSAAILGKSGPMQYLHLVGSFNTLRAELTMAANNEARLEVLEAQRAAIREAWSVPPWELRTLDPPAASLAGPSSAVIDALRGRGVHVEPWAVSLAWAHGLEWKPIPTMQSYAAYTRHLDELNAARLTRGPALSAILRQSAAIDGKHPFWESPRYQLSMLCNFVERESDGRWQALVRVPDRCGAPRKLGSFTVEPGAPIPVPHAGGALVLAEIAPRAGHDSSAHARPVVYCGAVARTLSQGFPSGPLVLRASAAGWDRRVIPAPCDTLGASQDIEVVFTEVPIRGGA